jgi:hypothetical protein
VSAANDAPVVRLWGITPFCPAKLVRNSLLQRRPRKGKPTNNTNGHEKKKEGILASPKQVPRIRLGWNHWEAGISGRSRRQTISSKNFVTIRVIRGQLRSRKRMTISDQFCRAAPATLPRPLQSPIPTPASPPAKKRVQNVVLKSPPRLPLLYTCSVRAGHARRGEASILDNSIAPRPSRGLGDFLPGKRRRGG